MALQSASITIGKRITNTKKRVKRSAFVKRANKFLVSVGNAAIVKNFSWTPILVIALIGAAYYLGTLRTELKFAQKQNTIATVAPLDAQAQGQPQGQPPQPTASIPPLSDNDHVAGKKNAKVIFVEYSDYECPFCKSFQPTVNQLLDEYGDKVAFVYRHFPLPFHANAQKEAEAAECVAEIGGNDAFWKFTKTIFERTTANGRGFALENLGPLAAELGVNQGQFQVCLDSGKYAQKIQDQMTSGQAAGVDGTPSTFIIGPNKYYKMVPGAMPLATVKQMLDEALKN